MRQVPTEACKGHSRCQIMRDKNAGCEIKKKCEIRDKKKNARCEIKDKSAR